MPLCIWKNHLIWFSVCHFLLDKVYCVFVFDVSIINRPHRYSQTVVTDVPWSVCVSVGQSREPYKEAEAIEMSFGVSATSGMWARLGPRNYVLDGGKYGSVNGHFSTLREMYSLARPGLLAVIACISYNHCSSQGEQRCERWPSYRSSLFLLSRGQDVLSVACVIDLHSACICSECQLGLCVKACTLLTVSSCLQWA